jgi:hypothetical protein
MIFKPSENLNVVVGILTRIIEESPEVHWWTIYPDTLPDGTLALNAVVLQETMDKDRPLTKAALYIQPGDDIDLFRARLRAAVLSMADLAEETGIMPRESAPRASRRSPWEMMLASGNGNGNGQQGPQK